MKRGTRAELDALRAVVAPAGCWLAVIHGSKHAQVIVTAPDGRWRKNTLTDPSNADHVCLRNYGRQLGHRLLREFGLEGRGG